MVGGRWEAWSTGDTGADRDHRELKGGRECVRVCVCGGGAVPETNGTTMIGGRLEAWSAGDTTGADRNYKKEGEGEEWCVWGRGVGGGSCY